jgi:hypothetical protein
MKHLFATLFAFFLSFTAIQAQEKTADKAQQEKAMSKEEKAAAKAKKEADLLDAFNQAGFSPEEQQLYRTSGLDRSNYGKKLKDDSSLTDDERKTKAREFSVEEDTKLKEKIGAKKFKAFKDIQKAQKEAQK